MSKKRAFKKESLDSIVELIEETVKSGLLLRSVIHGYYKQTDDVMRETDAMIDKLMELRKEIPRDFKNRIPN